MHLPWADDFSQARNDARGYLTGDWVLWLDAGDSQHVPAGRLHGVIALEDSEVLEVSTPEIDDVERGDELRLRRPDPGLHSSAH